LPGTVLTRARAVLQLLEGEQLVPALAAKNGDRSARAPRAAASTANDGAEQLALFGGAPDPLVARLSAIDANTLTPLQALQLLAELTTEAAGRRRS